MTQRNGSVVMMGIIYAQCHKQTYNVEYHYAECHYAKSRYAECHYAQCRGTFATALLSNTRLG